MSHHVKVDGAQNHSQKLLLEVHFALIVPARLTVGAAAPSARFLVVGHALVVLVAPAVPDELVELDAFVGLYETAVPFEPDEPSIPDAPGGLVVPAALVAVIALDLAVSGTAMPFLVGLGAVGAVAVVAGNVDRKSYDPRYST